MISPHQHLPHRGRYLLSEIILGGQDGLVNVLGVILGVAAASQEPRLVVAAGLAATFAESISMGAVAFTSTVTDAEHYQAVAERERLEIENSPDREREAIRRLYQAKGFTGAILDQAVTQITSQPKVWLDTIMTEELRMEPVDKTYAKRSSLIVGLAAVIGSLIPLVPFIFIRQPAQIASGSVMAIGLTAVSLFVIGAVKAKHTIGRPTRSGLTLALIGTISALAGYLVGLLFKAPTVP